VGLSFDDIDMYINLSYILFEKAFQFFILLKLIFTLLKI
jgi:hypothetical protein